MTTDPRTHIRDTILSDLGAGAQTARKWGELKRTYPAEFPEVWDELVSSGDIYVTEFDGRVRLGARPTPTPETAKLIRDALVGVDDMTMDKLEKKVDAADFAATMEHLVKKGVVDANFWIAGLTPEWQPAPKVEVVPPVVSTPETKPDEIIVPAPESVPEPTNAKSSTPRTPARRRETKPVPAPAAPVVTTPANPTLASIDRTLQQLTSVLTVGVGRGMVSGISPSADTDTYELNRRVLAQQIAVWLEVYGSLTRSDLAQGKVSHDQRQMLRDALDWGVLQGAFSVSSPRRGRYTLLTPTPLGLTAEAFQERVEAQRSKDAENRARFGARIANDNIAAARDKVLAR